jgi:hypothetical protein
VSGHKWLNKAQTKPVWVCNRCGASDFGKKKPSPGKKVRIEWERRPMLTCDENIARKIHES